MIAVAVLINGVGHLESGEIIDIDCIEADKKNVVLII